MNSREKSTNDNNHNFDVMTSQTEESSSPFEQLLEEIGSGAKFQKLLIFGFLIPLSLVNALGEGNTLLLLSSPSHSCHVPGRPAENVSLEQWKNFTIPWDENEGKGRIRNSCLMFKGRDHLETSKNISQDDLSSELTECEYGWDFDKSTWEATPVTDFEWVCDKKHLVTTVFSFTFVGNAVGTILFSLLSDRYGRKPISYVTVALNAICGSCLIFAPTLAAFSALKFFLSLAFCSFRQLPYIIVVELCGERARNLAATTGFICHVLGMCLLSLTAHLSSHWNTFVLACHLPALIFLLCFRFIPESPRWLLSQSRVAECEKVLKRMAKVNGKEYCERSRHLLLEAQKEATRKIPFSKVIRSFVLFKHLILTSGIISAALVIYTGIVLNIHNMRGNEVFNFFILSLVEIPGHVIASISGQYLGRRISAVIFSGLTAGFCLTCSFVANDPLLLLIFCSLSKLFSSSVLLVVYLQIGELFPTALRASAYGVVAMIAATSMTVAPSLVALGKTNLLLPYYILFGVGLLGLILSSLLPETIEQPLPQTVKAAMKIGTNQPFFSLIHKWNAHKYVEVSPPREGLEGLPESIVHRYSLIQIPK